jgi:hypothetical protein
MPFSGVRISFYLWIPQIFGRTPWAGDQSSAKASTYTGQHNTEKHRYTSMPRAEFEPAVPMFEQPKTVLALDRVAIENGSLGYYDLKEHNPWFDKCSKFLDQRKYVKLQVLQNPRQTNGDNMKIARSRTSRNFREKKREYLKEKISELLTKAKTKI